jgi:hypothetical protein
MSLRRIKKAVEDIIEGVLITQDDTLSIIKGSDQIDVSAVQVPRIFIAVESITNFDGFDSDAVFNIVLSVVAEYAFEETLNTDADDFFDAIDNVMLDLDIIRAEALSLYPSVNVSYSEFHFDQIIEDVQSTEFEDMTTRHIVNYNIIMQRLSKE